MIAAFPFDGEAFRIRECASGEECLAALTERPDVILLDVEMPGMDGIATCRALRAAGEERAHVIFVSVHNDLETRLRAYDAGGNDYVVKPFSPAELAQKVAVARELLEREKGLESQIEQAARTAFTAMSSMGELGVVLQFLRASFAVESLSELASELMQALQQYMLDGLVELRLAEHCWRASSQGECTQIELSILSHARGMGHTFQFRDRMVINYSAITLLASRLPLDVPDQLGRLRDNLAILAEGANARLAALASEMARQTQTQAVVHALADLSVVLELIERQQGENRLRALEMIQQHVDELERSFAHLGFSQQQEEALSQMARGMADQVGRLLGEDRAISDRLHGVIDRLRQIVRLN